MGAAPDRAAADAAGRRKADGDQFEVIGREVYLLCPNGYGRTKLTNAFFEKRLGSEATTRNWKTVTTLVDMAGGEPGGHFQRKWTNTRPKLFESFSTRW